MIVLPSSVELSQVTSWEPVDEVCSSIIIVAPSSGVNSENSEGGTFIPLIIVKANGPFSANVESCPSWAVTVHV